LIGELTPGRYFALALGAEVTEETIDPASLLRLEQAATPFTINQGEPSALTLTLKRADPD